MVDMPCDIRTSSRAELARLVSALREAVDKDWMDQSQSRNLYPLPYCVKPWERKWDGKAFSYHRLL
jgi:hypothetical protein